MPSPQLAPPLRSAKRDTQSSTARAEKGGHPKKRKKGDTQTFGEIRRHENWVSLFAVSLLRTPQRLGSGAKDELVS